MTISKIKRDCPHCGKSRDWKEDTGYTTQLLSGTIHGYVAWQETDDKTGKETFYCRPHGATSLLSPSRFDSMKNLGEYIGNNKLKTY
jgi:hypothetical protein|tara:strand:- start:55 stop:315 length:261 start_codon:yes stop_codon:yes gene_type:complete